MLAVLGESKAIADLAETVRASRQESKLSSEDLIRIVTRPSFLRSDGKKEKREGAPKRRQNSDMGAASVISQIEVVLTSLLWHTSR